MNQRYKREDGKTFMLRPAKQILSSGGTSCVGCHFYENECGACPIASDLEPGTFGVPCTEERGIWKEVVRP